MLKDESWSAYHSIINGDSSIYTQDRVPFATVHDTGIDGYAEMRAELMADAPTMLRLLDFCAEVAWRYFDCGDEDEPLELLSAFELVRKHKLWIKGEADAKG